MIIGAMKSGTTTLSQILSQHPDVCFCQTKEPHFFSKHPNWENALDEYR
ncbi:MAG: sulfotransferase, partial [Cyanobacteria bacterium P01_G01_bin.49]